MAIVNKLSVILEAKTKDFANGMKKADDKVKKFAESNRTLGDVVKNAGKAIAGMNPIVAATATIAVGAAVAIVKLTTATAAYAEGLQKMSIRLGISTETLSKMEFAAKQSGSSLRAMTPMFRSLSRAAFEANRGIKTYSDAFDKLGVTVKDSRTGALKPMEQLLGEVADAMQKTENQTEKLALAQMVLGRGAVDLLPLLEGGSEGIRALMEEAESLGATVSTKFANQSADFVDNLGRIKTIGRGVGITIAERVLPALNEFLDIVVDFSKRLLPTFQKAVDRTVFEFVRLAKISNAINNVLATMGDEAEKTERKTTSLWGNFAKNISESHRRSILGIKANESLSDALGFTGKASDKTAKALEELNNVLHLSFEEWQKNREKAEEAGETLDTVVTPAVHRFKGVLGDTLVTVQTFSENLEELIAAGLAFGPEQPTERETFMAGLGEQTDGVAGKVKSLGETFREFFDSTFDGARTLFNAFDTLASSIGKGLIDALKGGKVVFADFFKSLMEQLLQAILRALILQTILAFIPGFGGFKGFKEGFFGQLTRSLGGPLPAPAGGGGGGGTTGPITGSTASPAPIDPGVSQTKVVVHEATPQTWVEITDNEIEPRLLTRREELGSEI